MIDGDLTRPVLGTDRALREVKPDEIYNLGGPELCEDVVAPAAADRPGHRARRRRNMLEAVRLEPPGGALLPGLAHRKCSA